ncbi:MAG: hypothetical protein ABF322_05665 [Lentimonas sp.]
MRAENMKTWIQHHDLSIKELRCSDLDAVTNAYVMHDWEAEIEKEEINKGSDCCCRPAFGIEVDQNHILQIYP